VILTPDKSKTEVLRRGTWKVSRVEIPTGGHVDPISTEGASLL